MSNAKPILQLITLALVGLVIFEFVQKLREASRPEPKDEPIVIARPGDVVAPNPPEAPMLAPSVPEPAVEAVPEPPVMPEPEPVVAVTPPDTNAIALPPEKLPAGAIPDEYVLRFFSAADREAFARLARELGAEVLGELSLGNALRIRAGDQELLRRLLREGPTPVERGRNYYVRPPDDPLHVKKQPTDEKYVALNDRLLQWLGLDGPQADWGRGVTVAVIDTAVGKHPALSEGKVLRVDNYGMPAAGDVTGHGTAVASLIAGNGTGVDGVAPAARIISLPVMSGSGEGDTFTVAKAIVDAVAMGADIINLSLGAHGDSPVLRDAVNHALANNVAVVASTGNDGVNAVYYPAAYDGVLGVGATDANGTHLYFSNRGPGVDLVAPGFGVEAAWVDEREVGFSGTSASTPIVSGALAALLSQDQSLTPIQGASLLVATANDAGAPGWDESYGAGVLDLERAEQHENRGVYDMVAVAPHVTREGADGEIMRVEVYAQNRGTETLREVILNVDVDGRREQSRERNVAVGQTVSRTQRLDLRTVQLPHTFVITYDVSLGNMRDATPGNNRRQHLVTVRGE